MTTLQEAARKALYALEASIDGDHPYYEDQLTAIESLRTALAQQVERKNCPQPEICGSKECEFCRDTAAPAQQPVAYITDTEQGPMVWTPEMYDEACTYCDDGEFPVPLYTAAHVDLKRYDTAPNEVLFDVVMEAMVKGRAASSQPTDDNCQGIIDTSIRAASSTALTDAWIRERTKQPWVFDTVKQWVREIEAAHGIGRKPCS